MDENKIAIKVSGLKKRYRMGSIGGRTLQADLQSWWAKKIGREDPNIRIGTDKRLIGQTFWALNGIDLTIYKGEKVGIIGANGAGKSTLLKILSRITAPTEGEIDLYGRISSMLEIGTGFHREMTGRENIFMNGAILGMTKAEIESKLEDIIEFSEVRDFIDTPVKRYSSGMLVKLAFSVAAHLNSEIMVMDEVLAVGDMAFQQKCIAKMRAAADVEGRTVLYVSHNMNTIRQLCSRCIVLSQGRVIFDGDVERGIAMYMDHGLGDDGVDIQLDGKSTLRRELDTGIAMTRLRLLDKAEPIYAGDEELRMLLTMRVTKPYSDLKIRLTLRNNIDVGLGTSWSQPFSANDCGEKDILLSMPLSVLAKGELYGSIGVYRTDEIGKAIGLDHITRAFKIEIKGPPVWSTDVHGYINLPQIHASVE